MLLFQHSFEKSVREMNEEKERQQMEEGEVIERQGSMHEENRRKGGDYFL